MEQELQPKQWFCPNCREEMIQPDKNSNIFVCEECGCSVDTLQILVPLNKDKEVNIPEDISHGKNRMVKLFHKDFMKKYTNNENFTDFIMGSGLMPKSICPITYDIFSKISKEKLNEYVKKKTKFESWNEMFEHASSCYLRM